MADMSNEESIKLATDLMGIYVHAGTLNCTAQWIIYHLLRQKPDMARNEWRNDGDKLPSYSEWGKRFIHLLNTRLGCRSHFELNCQKHFCKKILEGL